MPGVVQPGVADAGPASSAFQRAQSDRGSIGRPVGWQNTSPCSSQTEPARSRWASWARRWALRRSHSAAGRAIRRRPARVDPRRSVKAAEGDEAHS